MRRHRSATRLVPQTCLRVTRRMASKAATRDGPYVSIGLKIFTVAVVILALMCAGTALTVHMAASVNRELQVLGHGYIDGYAALARANIRSLERALYIRRLYINIARRRGPRLERGAAAARGDGGCQRRPRAGGRARVRAHRDDRQFRPEGSRRPVTARHAARGDRGAAHGRRPAADGADRGAANHERPCEPAIHAGGTRRRARGLRPAARRSPPRSLPDRGRRRRCGPGPAGQCCQGGARDHRHGRPARPLGRRRLLAWAIAPGPPPAGGHHGRAEGPARHGGAGDLARRDRPAHPGVQRHGGRAQGQGADQGDLRQVCRSAHRAGPDRPAGAGLGQRRAPGHDHPVLRHEGLDGTRRLHHAIGPGRDHQPLFHDHVRTRAPARRHHRQVYRRRHHGVLGAALRGCRHPGPPRLRSRARPACRAARPGRGPARPDRRQARPAAARRSASASPPARCWSAASARKSPRATR